MLPNTATTTTTTKREDGRNARETRTLRLDFSDVLDTRCDGKAIAAIGGTRVETALFGPVEPVNRDITGDGIARLDVAVKFAFSMNMSPYEVDLASTIRKVFEPIILRQLFPGTVVSINVRILSDEGDLLGAIIMSVVGSCIQAQIPMTAIPTAVEICLGASSGSMATTNKDNTLWLDPTRTESLTAKACMTFGFLGQELDPNIVITQGAMTFEEFHECARVANMCCRDIRTFIEERARTEILKNKDLCVDL